MARDPLATTAQFIESTPRDPMANIDGEMGMGDIYNAYGGYATGGNDQNLYNSLAQRSNNFELSGDPQIAANIAAKNRAATAMPDLSYGDMFPSANNNINKGSYSGSIVGNVPVFAPSQLTPFGVFDKRDAALKNAAAIRAQEQMDFIAKTKAPTTKLFAVQSQLDDQFSTGYNKWVENAKKQYGENWSTALKQDPNFNNWMQNMSTVAQFHTGISDTIGSMEAQMKTGDFVASPELRNTIAELKSGIANLQNPFDPKGHKVGTNLLKARAVYSLDKTTNEALDKTVRSISESYPSLTPQGIYDMITSTTTTGVDDSRVAALAQEIYDTHYSDGSGFSKQQVYDALKAKLGEKVKTYDHKEQPNQFSNAGGSDITYDVTAVNPEGQDVNYQGTSVTASAGQTFAKPITLNVPNDVNAVDPKTGKPVTVGGNSRIVIGKTFNVLTDKDGKVVSKTDIEVAHKDPNFDPQKLGWSYQTFASGTINKSDATVTGVNDDGQTVSVPIDGDETMWIPVEGIKGGLATFDKDGNVTKGARIDVQKKEADKKTQELYQRHQAPAKSNGQPKYAQQGTDPVKSGERKQLGSGTWVVFDGTKWNPE